MNDTPTDAERIAAAISLKVLADAPDCRGPFVLELAEPVDDPAGLDRIRDGWREAFALAGRECPVLIILQGMTLRAAPDAEAAAADA